jgi:FkbM family methyltransferase
MSVKGLVRSILADAGVELRSNRYVNPLTLQSRLIADERPTIFDVGAYTGITFLTYRKQFPKAVIHAFEPFPDSFSELLVVIGDDPNGHAHRLALSNSAGTQTLHVNASTATNSLLPAEPQAQRFWGSGLLEEKELLHVETTTLDLFCAEHSIPQIDLMKLDVQGNEYAVLEGASDLLERQAIRLVYMEVILAGTYQGQRPFHDYLALMASNGYELVDLYNCIRREGRLLQMDVLFAVST